MVWIYLNSILILLESLKPTIILHCRLGIRGMTALIHSPITLQAIDDHLVAVMMTAMISIRCEHLDPGVAISPASKHFLPPTPASLAAVPIVMMMVTTCCDPLPADNILILFDNIYSIIIIQCMYYTTSKLVSALMQLQLKKPRLFISYAIQRNGHSGAQSSDAIVTMSSPTICL